MRTPVFLSFFSSSLILTAAAQAPVFELEHLGAPGATTGDRLGDNVQLTADWLVAGIPSRARTVNGEGTVVIWPRTGGTFGAPVLLDSPVPTTSGAFGTSICIDGDELVVGETRSLAFGAPARGAVHRYVLQSGVWNFLDSTANPGPASSFFAAAVARDGDLLVVGAPFETVQGQSRGAVHLFRLMNGAWQSEATLTASNGASAARFGEAVAVDAGRVIVGAYRQPNNGAFEGAAYAYELVGGVWTETGTFQVDPMTPDLGFGVSVGISGTTAVVGAARTNDPGAVYVFEDNGPGWTQVDRLRPSNLGNFATFGHAVSIEGDQLIVGAYQDSAAANVSGSAWVFERELGVWSPRVRLVQSGPTAFHGFSVGLDGMGGFAVGEPVGSIPGNPGGSGSIRYYRPERPIGTSYCTSVLNSTQRFGRVGAFGSEIATDDQVTLVAHQLPSNSFGYFITSQTQGMVNQPAGSQGILCLSGAIGRYVGAGQIQNSSLVRTFALPLDLSTTPTPTGLVQVAAGETWNFQAWYRDSLQGVATSNFTDGVSLMFL